MKSTTNLKQPAPTPDWSPFEVTVRPERAPPPRPISTLEGVGDRLRAAAFAEIQAREAFLWGAAHWADAPESLKTAWRELAHEEDKHLGWLLNRLTELGMQVTDRKVSDQLWVSLTTCRDAADFALFMASAEERGRRAGERFHQDLKSRDPVTATLFETIAREEVAHIELARKHFPNLADQYLLPRRAETLSTTRSLG